MELSRSESEVLNNALNEVLHGPDAIDEWEFQTRIGVTRTEAEALLQRLRSEINRSA